MADPKKYFLGIDVGSSSVKTCLFDAESGASVASASIPEKEQNIEAPRPGWAEQAPKMWWDNFETGFAGLVSLEAILVSGAFCTLFSAGLFDFRSTRDWAAC